MSTAAPEDVLHLPTAVVAGLRSGDYSCRAGDVMPEMCAVFRLDPGIAHPRAVRHGGPRAYVNHLAADIHVRGIQSPLQVTEDMRILRNGHHRLLAAIRLDLPTVPVFLAGGYHASDDW